MNLNLINVLKQTTDSCGYWSLNHYWDWSQCITERLWNDLLASSRVGQRGRRESWCRTGCGPVPHHSEHVEASLAQQVAQVGDSGVGGHVGGESSLPLGLGELEGAAQLVQGVPTHHRPNEHPVWFQHLMDLRGGGEVSNQLSQQGAPFTATCRASQDKPLTQIKMAAMSPPPPALKGSQNIPNTNHS